MSWAGLHARIGVVHEVLERAAGSNNLDDVFAGIADIDRLFGSRDGLLLALRYRWIIHLEAKLDTGYEQAIDTGDAYRELASEQPELHRILTCYGLIGHPFAQWPRPVAPTGDRRRLDIRDADRGREFIQTGAAGTATPR